MIRKRPVKCMKKLVNNTLAEVRKMRESPQPRQTIKHGSQRQLGYKECMWLHACVCVFLLLCLSSSLPCDRLTIAIWKLTHVTKPSLVLWVWLITMVTQQQNRTLSSVPNDIFVYLTTSEMRTPQYSGHFNLAIQLCPDQ